MRDQEEIAKLPCSRRRGGAGQEIDLLNQPPRRFAAPRLDQGGEFAFLELLCKASFGG